jgi:ribosomal protein S7
MPGLKNALQINAHGIYNGRSMADKLANEIITAVTGLGAGFKKKEDAQWMAEGNKAFSPFKIYITPHRF